MKRSLFLFVLMFIFITLGTLVLNDDVQSWARSEPANASAGQGGNALSSKITEEGFDCSRIESLGINHQQNAHAYLLLEQCGRGRRIIPNDRDSKPQPQNGAILLGDNYGSTDANTITHEGPGNYPKVTQAESFVWANGNTIVVNYDDTTDFHGPSTPTVVPVNISGLSYSTDGGVSFERIRPAPFAPGASGGDHGTNYGDPIVVYSARENKWYGGDLVKGCSNSKIIATQGIGLWSSTDGINWTVSACAHTNNGVGGDDRESMWVDNNPSSDHYGRMYITWSDISQSDEGLYITYKDYNTAQWSQPIGVHTGVPHLRNGQITGSSTDSTLFVAALDRGNSVEPQRTNYMFRSTDGGDTWTQLTLSSPTYPAPGTTICTGEDQNRGISPIWIFEGYGEPGVGPPLPGQTQNVVHYVYGQHGEGNDLGDILYIRSTDNGNTWSTPVILNTDQPPPVNGRREQWMPSLAVTQEGAVFVSWYDRSYNDPSDTSSYRYVGRASTDNGTSWQNVESISDVLIPQPAQPDPSITTCFTGDYNYHSANGNAVSVTWTDGRVAINGYNQQDVYFDKVTLQGQGGATPTPGGPTSTPTPITTPAPCAVNGDYTIATGTGIIVQAQPTTVVTTECNPCITIVALPFNYSLYDSSFNSAIIGSNGTLGFVRNDNIPDNFCLPTPTSTPFDYAILPYWDSLYVSNGPNGCTSADPCGIYTSTSGAAPNRIFNIEWRVCQQNPRLKGKNPQGASPCGGIDGSGRTNFEVRLYEGQTKFDIIYGPSTYNGFGSTIGVQKDTGSQYTQYSCDTQLPGGVTRLTFTLLPECTPTPEPTATYTPTYTPTATDTPTCEPSPTPVPGNCQIQFKDVPPGSEFYPYVRCLACRGIATGYPCGAPGEPCDCQLTPYFRPYYEITRGQIAKVVSEAAGFQEDPGPQIYQDVKPSDPFYVWINRLTNRQIIGGYQCGSVPEEPCSPPNNRPYFRPGAPTTRGQLSKIDSNAAGYQEPVSGQTYTDVSPNTTTGVFYEYIERLTARGIVSGYRCGLFLWEPCDPQNRPYFRPYNSSTRSQAAKIVANTFFPSCQSLSPGVGVSVGTPSAVGTGTPPPPPPSPPGSPTTYPTSYIPSPVPSVPRPVPSVPMPVSTAPTSVTPVTTTTVMPTAAP